MNSFTRVRFCWHLNDTYFIKARNGTHVVPTDSLVSDTRTNVGGLHIISFLLRKERPKLITVCLFEAQPSTGTDGKRKSAHRFVS